MIWGTTITPGNEYALVFKEELHLSLATLESRDEYGSASGSPCHLILTTKRANYLLCTLLNRVVYQQALDLTLMPNEKVTFKCQGETKIYLTGYTKKEPTNNGHKISLDDRAQRSADAALGEHAAEGTSTSDLSVDENTCAVIVGKDVTTMVEDAEDCNKENGIAMLNSYHGNEIEIKHKNEENDLSPVKEGSDREKEITGSNDCSSSESLLNDTDGQEENILVQALRDCLIGRGKTLNNYHSERNLVNSRNSDPTKGSPEDAGRATLCEVSYRNVLHQIGSDDWMFLTGKGIKTEEEERGDEDAYQQRDVDTEGRSARYITSGDISCESNCGNKVESAEEYEGLNDCSNGSVTENKRYGGSMVILETNCKGDGDSEIVSEIESTQHDNSVMDSVNNNTPGSSSMDSPLDNEENNGTTMKSLGNIKIQDTGYITSVGDDMGHGGTSIISMERDKGHVGSSVTLEANGNGHIGNRVVLAGRDKVHGGFRNAECEDSLPASENKHGKLSCLKSTKTDLECQLNTLKGKLSGIQNSRETNMVIDECLDIVRNMPLSNAGDFKFSVKREEDILTSSDELPDLELDIDDIVIKEEIDLDNAKELEDIDIMFLNTFHGRSVTEAQELILKKEDLNFHGLFDDFGQCLDGGFCTIDNHLKKTGACDAIMKEEASDTVNPVKKMECEQRAGLASLSSFLREYTTGTCDVIKKRAVPDIKDPKQLRIEALEKMLQKASSEPIDFKLEVSHLHPHAKKLTAYENEEVTNEVNEQLTTSRSQYEDRESSPLGVFAQNSSIQDVFTSKVRNLKVTLSRQEVRKAMSDQVVKREEDDVHVPTDDEADASRSEVSDTMSCDDETDWEAIVESRSERDTKKRKSKTKAKEVTAKLLKEIGDVLESDDEDQRQLPEDRNEEHETDNEENDGECTRADVETALGEHSKGERKLKSKFTKKRKQYRTEKLLTSDSTSNKNSEKCNKRKEHPIHQEEMRAPQKKKFCLPVKLSLMQNVKTPRHRRRVNHTRLKCRYCNKSYLYTGSLRRHETAHRENYRSSIQGRACGDSHKQLNQHKRLSNIKPSKKPAKCHFSKNGFDTLKKCTMHEAKHKSTQCACLNSDKVPPTKHSQKQLDIHNEENDKLANPPSVKSPKQSGNFTTQEKGHDPPRPFKCKFCPKNFIHVGSLKSHEMSHDEKTFKCPTCEEGFSKPDQLEKHESLKHDGKMPFACPICHTHFTSDSDCDIHLQKRHVNPKISANIPCQKTQKNLEMVKSDKLTSVNVPPHKCKSCGKSFRSNSVLKKHEDVHKGKKPFTCRICKKAFRMLDNCRRHEGKHTKEDSVNSQSGDLAVKQTGNREITPLLSHKTILRPFNCKYCSKTFSTTAVRKSHEKEHTEGKMDFSQFSSKNASQLSNKNISQFGCKIPSFKDSQKRKYSLSSSVVK